MNNVLNFNINRLSWIAFHCSAWIIQTQIHFRFLSLSNFGRISNVAVTSTRMEILWSLNFLWISRGPGEVTSATVSIDCSALFVTLLASSDPTPFPSRTMFSVMKIVRPNAWPINLQISAPFCLAFASAVRQVCFLYKACQLYF